MTAEHHQFTNLPEVLTAKDLLVVNNSGTLPAALTGRLIDGSTVAVHVSSAEPNERGAYLVELRRPAAGRGCGAVSTRSGVAGRGRPRDHAARPCERAADRAFHRPALVRGDPAAARHVARGVPRLVRQGDPVRLRGPRVADRGVSDRVRDRAGQQRDASAARPFTAELVKELERRGTTIAPITLHTGVASPEAHEAPYAERFKVPAATAELVERTRRTADGSSLSAPRSCARSNPPSTPRATCAPPTAGPT